MLPTNVDRFLRTSIRSVWDLELLLLLYGHKERAWTADELLIELRASVMIVTVSLDALQKIRLVANTGKDAEKERFRYWPVTPELDELVAALAAAYASFPAAVRDTIWSAPNASVRTFADAFKIKKD